MQEDLGWSGLVGGGGVVGGRGGGGGGREAEGRLCKLSRIIGHPPP